MAEIAEKLAATDQFTKAEVDKALKSKDLIVPTPAQGAWPRWRGCCSRHLQYREGRHRRRRAPEDARPARVVLSASRLSTAPQGLDPYEVLIVANMIEREAKVDADRAKIAAVISPLPSAEKRWRSTPPSSTWSAIPAAMGPRRARRTTPTSARACPDPDRRPGEAAIKAALQPADGDETLLRARHQGGRARLPQRLAGFPQAQGRGPGQGPALAVPVAAVLGWPWPCCPGPAPGRLPGRRAGRLGLRGPPDPPLRSCPRRWTRAESGRWPGQPDHSAQAGGSEPGRRPAGGRPTARARSTPCSSCGGGWSAAHRRRRGRLGPRQPARPPRPAAGTAPARRCCSAPAGSRWRWRSPGASWPRPAATRACRPRSRSPAATPAGRPPWPGWPARPAGSARRALAELVAAADVLLQATTLTARGEPSPARTASAPASACSTATTARPARAWSPRPARPAPPPPPTASACCAPRRPGRGQDRPGPP